MEEMSNAQTGHREKEAPGNKLDRRHPKFLNTMSVLVRFQGGQGKGWIDPSMDHSILSTHAT